MVGAADAPVVAVLTRAPSSGGKSRLFGELGRPTDPVLLRALLLDTFAAIDLPHVARAIAVTPATAISEIRALAPEAQVIAQPEGDLGERMHATMAHFLVRGARGVALIGSDVPHINPTTITSAFDCLAADRNALVVGPATDGGYYLVAAARVPAIFTGIEWGSEHVLARTIAAARADGFDVHQLEPLADIDSLSDLRRAVVSGRAPRTAAWHRAHVPGGDGR